MKLRDVEAARQFLNGHPLRGTCRHVKQGTDAPRGFVSSVLKVFPFDPLGLAFAEAYESGRSRHVCGPPVPFAYVIRNGERQTRYRASEYGRAMRHFAALVERRESAL